MKQLTQDRGRRLTRLCMLLVLFLALAFSVFLWLNERTPELLDERGGTDVNAVGRMVYTLAGAVLLAGLAAAWFDKTQQTERTRRPVWFCPAAAAALSLTLMLLGYAYLGVWPLGRRALLTVDMHHQYAPLLCELRDRLLKGDFSLYTFHMGLGANFLPAYAYYLASPLNLLLLLFPESMLTEAILLITLLKNAAAAAGFAACAQYLFRRRDAGVVALAVLYSCSMYMLAYSWNIMWLDVVALTPVVVLSLEHLLRTGRLLPYTLTLALALFANYYLTFMLCVFLVLYFAVWLLRKARPLSASLRGFGRFALGSALAGGLAAVLLVPTALALAHTSAAGEKLPAFDSNFPLFDLLGQMFYGTEPTIRSGNLPNLYCGVAAVLLVPVYITQRTLPLRRRLCSSGLLAVLLLSCTINRWDRLWHGLHTPNDLPYRFSYLVGFVMLLMAAELLPQLRQVRPRQILCSLSACALYLVLWEKFDTETAPTDTLLYTNLLLLAVYAGILLLTGRHKLTLRAGTGLLLLAVTTELTLGTGETLTTLRDNEGFTDRSSYMANDSFEATNAALRRAEELAEEQGSLFCRMEYTQRNTCMDTALRHYNGLTTFASSNPYSTTCLMGDLGYAINGVNSYLYHSYVPLTDSLLSLRYLVLNNEVSDYTGLRLADTVTVKGYTRYIYENTLALPVGFLADNAVNSYRGIAYAPFHSQEQLASALTGESVELYTLLPMDTDAVGAGINGSSFSKSSSLKSADYIGTVEESGLYLIYLDCGAADSISVSIADTDGAELDSFNVTPYEPYIVNAGILEAGSTVTITVSGEGSMTGNIYVMQQDPAAVQQCLTKLAEGGLQVTKASASTLTGTVVANREKTLLFSIPYDSGWRVTVDGQPAETIPVGASAKSEDGALLGVPVEAGEHTVVLRYRTPGLLPGLLITLLSAAFLILYQIRRRPRSEKAPALVRMSSMAEAPVSPAPAADPAAPAKTVSPDSSVPSLSPQPPSESSAAVSPVAPQDPIEPPTPVSPIAPADAD